VMRDRVGILDLDDGRRWVINVWRVGYRLV
jgi:hypothetical protein